MNVKKDFLTKNEKEILANGYKSDFWEVYSKILAVCKQNLAMQNMTVRDTRLNDENRGKLAQILWEENQMKHNYLVVDRSKKKKGKK